MFNERHAYESVDNEKPILGYSSKFDGKMNGLEPFFIMLKVKLKCPHDILEDYYTLCVYISSVNKETEYNSQCAIFVLIGSVLLLSNLSFSMYQGYSLLLNISPN